MYARQIAQIESGLDYTGYNYVQAVLGLRSWMCGILCPHFRVVPSFADENNWLH